MLESALRNLPGVEYDEYAPRDILRDLGHSVRSKKYTKVLVEEMALYGLLVVRLDEPDVGECVDGSYDAEDISIDALERVTSNRL
ncbi:hypothetical protein ACC680_36815, partial [Rhizobium ruizarguesonis]